MPKRDRFPANNLHNLLPKDWGQGKQQRAINRYKKDQTKRTKKLRARIKRQTRKPQISLTSNPTTVCGSSIIKRRSGTNKPQYWRAGTTAGHTSSLTTSGRITTTVDVSYGPYNEEKIEMRPQSIGSTRRRQRNSLTESWNLPNPHTLPFCPATKTTSHLAQ